MIDELLMHLVTIMFEEEKFFDLFSDEFMERLV